MAIKVKSSWPGNTTDFYRINESEGINWTWQDWPTGSPITQGKLQNLENGVAILATQMSAILGEIGDALTLDKAGDIQINSSRLDELTTTIYGGLDTSKPSRLDDLEKEICGKTIARSTNGAGYEITRIDALTKNLYGNYTTDYTGDSRLDNIQKWITNSTTGTYTGTCLDQRIGGIEAVSTQQSNRLTAIEALSTTQNGKLDSVENKNTEQDGRLNTLESTASTHTTKLNAIETLNTAQNNRLTALENELSGTSTGTSGTSRLDNLQTWITGSSTGAYNDEAISTKLGKIKQWILGTSATDYTNAYSVEERLQNAENLNKQINDQNGILTTVNRHTSEINRLINEIETSTVTSKIPLLRATNTTASDTITLASTAILTPEAITLIMLNAGTLGKKYLEIQDPSGTVKYTVYVTNNTQLTAKFSAGSLLGIYLNSDAKAYMFNAPLAL